MTPISVDKPESLRLRSGAGSNSVVQSAEATLEDIESLVNVPLRNPLKDPPRKQATVQQPKRTPPTTPRALPNPRLTLLAAIIDPERNIAIIADARGITDIKGVGEELELMPKGATVSEIRGDRVTIEFRGRKIPLELSKSSPGRTGGSRVPVRRTPGNVGGIRTPNQPRRGP